MNKKCLDVTLNLKFKKKFHENKKLSPMKHQYIIFNYRITDNSYNQ